MVEPSCEKDGYTMHTCANCGDSYTDNETSAFGHSMVHINVAPTCTANGHTTHKCSICPYIYTDVIVSEGHVWGDWAVINEADEDVEGSKERVCSSCGEKEVEIIPAMKLFYLSMSYKLDILSFI